MPGPVEPEDWLKPVGGGLYCVPGDFHIDPTRRAGRAVITHGHGDHARPGHDHVLATRETVAIMKARLGAKAGGALQAAAYGERVDIGNVRVWLKPAGHVLGSAQVVLEYAGQRIVVSGDYKRQPDPTCPPFEVVPCDVFVTEATFALPVYRHPPASAEIAKLLDSVNLYPERCHVVGAYPLGKCQRVIGELRAAGHDATIFLHPAQRALCDLYGDHGIDLGPLRDVADIADDSLAGAIIVAPPGASIGDWSPRLPDPVAAMASGWMGIRARARQRNVELPLVISDHGDWDELTWTIRDIAPGEVWITHGSEDALIHWCRTNGFAARALALIGRGDEDAR